jgi:hypothetical protein
MGKSSVRSDIGWMILVELVEKVARIIPALDYCIAILNARIEALDSCLKELEE